MNSLVVMTMLSLVFTLGGCATKQSISEKKMDALNALLAAGKYDVAIAVSRNEFMYDNAESFAVRKMLATYPGVAVAFKSRMGNEIAAQSNSYVLETYHESIKLALRDGIVKDADANDLVQETARRIEILARTLHVPSHVWEILTPEQQQSVQGRYVANAIPSNSYGTIIDAQSLNESTPGSNAGSQLGAAIGQAAYVDNAFKGNTWNYSATSQIAAGLAGAMIGSLANTAPKAQFRTRYTIRLGNGQIEYVDETKSEPFRQTVGLCVALSPIRPIEQTFCTITKEVFLSKYLPQEARSVSDERAVTEYADQRNSASRLLESVPVENQRTTQQKVPVHKELSVGDIAWNEQGPITGYVAPNISAKISQQIEIGTSFQVQAVLKDWAKVRLGSGLIVWVEKRHLSWASSKN